MEHAHLSKLFNNDPGHSRSWAQAPGDGLSRTPALARRPMYWGALYLVAAGVGELTGILTSPVTGVLVDALLLLALTTHYVYLTMAADRSLLGTVGGAGLSHDADALRRALLALALLPTLRLLSLVMPTQSASPLGTYILTGGPLLLAVAMAARALGLSPTGLGLGTCRPGPQVVIALVSAPVAVIAYAAFRPFPLVPNLDVHGLVPAALVLILCSALVEEVLFRGLLLRALNDLFGAAGPIWSAAIFAFFYLGTLSPTYVLTMFATGLFYGWCVSRTGSLWGVVVGHSVINIGALIVLPLVWK